MVCLAASLGGLAACSSEGDQGAGRASISQAPPSSTPGTHAGVMPEGPAPVPARSMNSRRNDTRLVERLPSLRAAGRPSARLSYALRSKAWKEVALLQMALKVIDSPGLKVDGRFGLDTLYSVMGFQRASGIRVTGVAGPVTLRALAQALSAPGGAVPPPPPRPAP